MTIPINGDVNMLQIIDPADGPQIARFIKMAKKIQWQAWVTSVALASEAYNTSAIVALQKAAQPT